MNALADVEVVELLRDRPDLLAIADAVAATQPRPRRRPRLVGPLAIVPVAAAAVVALLLVAPWRTGSVSVVDRALAAVGGGPVVHAIVSYRESGDVLLDPATGATTPRTHTIEYWWDADERTLRTRLATDGERITEIVETPAHAWSDIGDFPTGGGFAPQLDPALAGFATGYREALAKGSAREVGHTTVDGRDAVTLELTLDHGSEYVDVDATTYLPLRIRPVDPSSGARTLRVTSIEAVPFDAALFAHPAASPPRPTGGVPGFASTSTTVATAGLGAELAGHALWLGPSFRGDPASQAEVRTAAATLTDGSTVTGKVATIVYGNVRVGESPDPAGAYALGMDDGGDPVPTDGTVAVTTMHGTAHGELRRAGLWIAIDAPDEPSVLAAARALDGVH